MQKSGKMAYPSKRPYHWEGGAASGIVGRDYEIIGDPRSSNMSSSSSAPAASSHTETRVEWPLFPTPTISILQISGYEVYNGTPVSLFSCFVY